MAAVVEDGDAGADVSKPRTLHKLTEEALRRLRHDPELDDIEAELRRDLGAGRQLAWDIYQVERCKERRQEVAERVDALEMRRPVAEDSAPVKRAVLQRLDDPWVRIPLSPGAQGPRGQTAFYRNSVTGAVAWEKLAELQGGARKSEDGTPQERTDEVASGARVEEGVPSQKDPLPASVTYGWRPLPIQPPVKPEAAAAEASFSAEIIDKGASCPGQVPDHKNDANVGLRDLAPDPKEEISSATATGFPEYFNLEGGVEEPYCGDWRLLPADGRIRTHYLSVLAPDRYLAFVVAQGVPFACWCLGRGSPGSAKAGAAAVVDYVNVSEEQRADRFPWGGGWAKHDDVVSALDAAGRETSRQRSHDSRGRMPRGMKSELWDMNAPNSAYGGDDDDDDETLQASSQPVLGPGGGLLIPNDVDAQQPFMFNIEDEGLGDAYCGEWRLVPDSVGARPHFRNQSSLTRYLFFDVPPGVSVACWCLGRGTALGLLDEGACIDWFSTAENQTNNEFPVSGAWAKSSTCGGPLPSVDLGL